MCGYTVGFYFTLFYLQLDAFTHGINQTLSFYSVSAFLFLLLPFTRFAGPRRIND
jgi:hypothetical protein